MGSRVKPGSLIDMKQRGEAITMLTCYDYPTALCQEAADVDVIFVGDSVGVNVLGYESPQQVTMEDMIHHTNAVHRGVQKALLVADLPYGSYEMPAQAVENAARLLDAGAEVVKLERGREIIESVSGIVAEGIDVIGHVGHTPQTRMSGRAVVGDRADEAHAVFRDARGLEDAGVIAVVLECVPERISEIITDSLKIPTIGIGAGRNCGGQVLVNLDLLGVTDARFSFVKQYAELSSVMENAFSEFVADVKVGRFPGEEHRFKIKREELRKFKASVLGAGLQQ